MVRKPHKNTTNESIICEVWVNPCSLVEYDNESNDTQRRNDLNRVMTQTQTRSNINLMVEIPKTRRDITTCCVEFTVTRNLGGKLLYVIQRMKELFIYSNLRM